MDAAEEPFAVVERLWEDHKAEFRWPMPKRFLTLEVAGVDLLSTEVRLAGCVFTWVKNGGSLHERGMGTVRFILGQLDEVLPALTEDDSPQVWHRMHRVSQLIVAHNTPPAETTAS
ncbi:hypothetical protein ATKI12_0400 [Kitasatospora sp. Ki12]|uniref:hypothetical protein n=1 Tax=Kitasatospora xanthocidica TaxID=83382 RepID=UPI001672038C|nr:hypothetical protein [Kitasatospora xanthocidica]GHF51894.1 hypothetical protein GCM10018790_32270 [Kitasatospora xanthocidica]